MAAMLPGLASANIVDGRPGQYELAAIGINGYDDSGYVEGWCLANYVTPENGNIWVSNGSEFADHSDAKVSFKVNKNGAKVICKIPDDGSGIYEANAEVGNTNDCTAFTEDGLWEGGTGRLTAAANNAKDGSTGGNVTFMCTFDAEDFTADP